MSSEVMKCSVCHSEDLRKAGTRLLSGGRKKQLYQCRKCGSITGGKVLKEGDVE